MRELVDTVSKGLIQFNNSAEEKCWLKSPRVDLAATKSLEHIRISMQSALAFSDQSSTLERLLMLYARRFPVRHGKLRVINSCWRAAVRNQDTHRIAALNHGGFTMRCDLSEMLQRQFYFFGTYLVEADILQCWELAAKNLPRNF